MDKATIKFKTLRTLEDFKNIDQEMSNKYSRLKGLQKTQELENAFYKCKSFIKKQAYYQDHPIRKNGAIAIWVQVECNLNEYTSIDQEIEKLWESRTAAWINLDIYRNQFLELFSNVCKEGNVYTMNKIFTCVDNTGKIALYYITRGSRQWVNVLTCNYISCMNTSSPYFWSKGEIESVRTSNDEKSKIKELEKECASQKRKIARYEKIMDFIPEQKDSEEIVKQAELGKQIAAVYKYYAEKEDSSNRDYIKALLVKGKALLEREQ